ncbi:copper homeostasis protein [Pedococcus dokdonensis]|uniref:PF03932 family protein CutC n=1 Tax=Pedococcus dokdonensis TaxID=443156 RepID=A0A1H0RCB7_9MICO|nr:copper homeostasis protein CutC [Pedococcus dokdonensis]SDP27193.1 copper homeostasis protein [Pedococcus dokdonensis]
MTLLEICLDDVDGAPVAEDAGADRLELCADLRSGGTTPSIGTLEAVLDSVRRVGVQVLVRQRPGDFVYSAGEVRAMELDVRAIVAAGAAAAVPVGVVVGALTRAGAVDREVTARLVDAAAGTPVTFHKAFDDCVDQLAALDDLVHLGVQRVLTSGGRATALEGADMLRELVARADQRITVLAGGRVRADHVQRLVADTGVGEVHLRAVGRDLPGAQGQVTSGEVVAAVRAALGADRETA